MKRIFFLIALVITGLYTEAQSPLYYSATSGVRFKRHNKILKSVPPREFSTLSMNDVFYLEENDTVSVIYNKQRYFFWQEEKRMKTIRVEQIISQHRIKVWTGVRQATLMNYESWQRPHKGKTRAAATTLSTSAFEEKYANQIKSYFRASINKKQQMIDSTIVLEKQAISASLFFFRILNNSSTNYYIYIVQNDKEGTSLPLNQTWGDSDDGEVGLVFCLPAFSYLDIDDFVFYEDNETQYVPVAIESKLNLRLLQEELQKETIVNESESLLKIGVCRNVQ